MDRLNGMQPHRFIPHSNRYGRGMVLLLMVILMLGLLQPAQAQAQTVPSGYVVGWGWNHVGQINIPPGLNDVIAVSASQITSLALKRDGTVVAWGNNVNNISTVPSGLSGVIAVAAGDGHSLALKSDGTVVAWGLNGYGQTNIPPGLNDVIAISAGEAHSLALKRDGTVVGWGRDDYKQSTTPIGLSHVVAIDAGGVHSLALKDDGTVVVWGSNRSDQLAIPGGLTGVVAISAGNAYNLAVKRDGTVVAWGSNEFGEIDVPDGLSGVVAVVGGYAHSLALKSDGTVVAWGNNSYHQLDIPAGVSGVVAIAAGWHSLVVIPPASVTVNQAAGQADPASTTPIRFTARFSKSVTDFTAADVTLSGTANLANAAVTISGGPSVYTISVDGVTGRGTVIAFIAAEVAADANGYGNLASTSTDNSVTVNLDSTGPVITPNVAGTSGANDWYVSDVTIGWSVVDSQSTVTNRTGCDPQTVTSDSANVTFTCTATSAGGTSSQTVTIKRDATAPTIAFVTRTAANSNGWNNSPVTVNWSCSDATSGVVSASASQTLGDEGANQSATGICTDKAGNSASNTQSGINIDTTAPTVTATPDRAPDSNGWYNAAVSFSFRATDTTNGSSSVTCDSAKSYSGPDSANARLAGACTDAAGNVGSASATFKYDETKPSITASAKTADGQTYTAGTWTNQTVSVSFSCSDTLSGLLGSCPASQAFSSDGDNQSASASISDNAGNGNSASFGPILLDKTKPTVTITSPTATSYQLNQNVTASFNCNDGLSGIASCVGTVANNGSLDTSSVGSKTYTVTATDRVGNVYSQSVSYTVGYNWEGFFQPVDNLPTVNTANAGRTIPLKWRVTSANGNPVTDLTTVTVTSAAGGCSTSAPTDPVDVYATSNTGLQNMGNGYYQFNWQTQKSWAGSCRTLKLDLGDGQPHAALFQFR